MATEDSNAILQRQMEMVRHDFSEHANAMVDKARSRLAWENYVIDHLWGSFGACVLLGYCLAPRRSRLTRCEPAREAALPPPTAPASLATLLSNGATSLVGVVAREGLAYAAMSIKQWLASRNADADFRTQSTPPRPAQAGGPWGPSSRGRG